MTVKALVVDDNVALARVMQFALERAGFQTETAGNGQLGLAAAKESQFDVVISDQQMPYMSGLELCEELRKMPQYQEVPFVLLTAKGLELDLSRLKSRFGVSGMYSKPFSPAAMVQVILELTNQVVHA